MFNRFLKWETLVKFNANQFSNQLGICLDLNTVTLFDLPSQILIIWNEAIVEDSNSAFLI